MKLASDPTVEYALGIRQTVDKPLTYAQVETPSPYNTYLNPGLPPPRSPAPVLPALRQPLIQNPPSTSTSWRDMMGRTFLVAPSPNMKLRSIKLFAIWKRVT